jgi:hypothetical protein
LLEIWKLEESVPLALLQHGVTSCIAPGTPWIPQEKAVIEAACPQASMGVVRMWGMRLSPE